MITRRILEPGDTILLVVKGQFDLCFCNDLGGTAEAPPGEYWVTVEKVWHDYETGYRATGRLIREKDIAVLRKLGTTPWEPKMKEWNPAHVMFAGELEKL